MTDFWSLSGQCSRLLSTQPLRCSPCSVHNPEQALVYSRKLLEYAKEAEEDLMVIMRVYFEKCVARRQVRKYRLMR